MVGVEGVRAVPEEPPGHRVEPPVAGQHQPAAALDPGAGGGSHGDGRGRVAVAAGVGDAVGGAPTPRQRGQDGQAREDQPPKSSGHFLLKKNLSSELVGVLEREKYPF